MGPWQGKAPLPCYDQQGGNPLESGMIQPAAEPLHHSINKRSKIYRENENKKLDTQWRDTFEQ